MDSEHNTSPPEARSPKVACRKRGRRAISPRMLSSLLDPWIEPNSPTSSMGPEINIDSTFEPTIEMMVDDFDDEQTLNEEEALAASELQDPRDEIATLQSESEMPIEELLAKYQRSLPFPLKTAKKGLKLGSKIKNNKKSKSTAPAGGDDPQINDKRTVYSEPENGDVIVIDSGEDENEVTKGDQAVIVSEDADSLNEVAISPQPEHKEKQRHSHLLDLYMENRSSSEEMSEDTLYDEDNEDDDDDDEDEDDDDEEDQEKDPNYVRKRIMVGSAYQAAIPNGLSKYGDVLPYENEDKLIWEPSQVSEKEVEEYLMKTSEVKNYSYEKPDQIEEYVLASEDTETTSTCSPIPSKNIVDNPSELKQPNVDSQLTEELTLKMPTVYGEIDTFKVVKDNEQALHLLVQCGYDFKEALRRKRLNAMPLNGSMSIWSEEECLKFEEGIQKFGKDFLKIRQFQVRTRSMRELVQFYYLWKKSERRDHEFADSDTVDHMDMYLNEGDYNSNSTSTVNVNATGLNATCADASNNRKYSSNLKNFSIMTGISMQNTFSPKASHIRRHTSYSDKPENSDSEKCDSQNVLLNIRK